ncbi:hypothetical protein LMTR13_24770 [Bradyrhizobium icense]|uniref:Uncharacterized protein n=1 Tax=Bradyrhizobium icense TaxID=1274631 RepID=A0A1B1UJP7_9BRAD|nr:hypothetical protein LMTR13_24770 [Bradyrhizobium icense]
MRSIVQCKSAQGLRSLVSAAAAAETRDRVWIDSSKAPLVFGPLSLIQINDKLRRASRAVVVTTNVAIPSANVRLQ